MGQFKPMFWKAGHGQTTYARDAFICALISIVNAGGAEPSDKAAAKAAEAADLVKTGAAVLRQGQYAEALRAFEKSLDKAPANKETRFLAALAAYWARKPSGRWTIGINLLTIAPRAATTNGK